MKFCLNLEKTASSAFIFATLSCLAANFSPTQAAPAISTATVQVESSTQALPASTLPTTAEKAEVAPAASHLTGSVLTNPSTESIIPAVGGDTSVKTTAKQTSVLAVATPTNPLTRSETALSGLKPSAGTEASNETNLKDLTAQPHLEAQAVPTEVEASESMSPTTAPESLEPTEGDDAMNQVTTVTQLSDVRPTDWAYEALRSLVERYGCIAGYPDRSFRGNQAMSRYEFAAGLNACMQQIERLIASSTTDFVRRQDLEALRRLIDEFRTELTALAGRVDKLEGRAASLENNQFSTTTKLYGQAVFGVQGRSENSFDFFPPNRLDDQGTNINLIDYVQLSLFTQFSPSSLLLTGLAAGNGNNTAIRLDRYTSLGYETGTNNNLELSDLNYRQLIGSKFAVILGPVGVNPVNIFRGVNRVESAGQGPLSRFAQRNPIINIGGNGGGIGFDWQLGTRLSLQGVYTANRSEDPANGSLFGGKEGTTTAGVQLVVSPTDQIDLSLQYLNSYSPSGFLGTGVGDDLLAIQTVNPLGFPRAPIQTNAIGASLEWRVTPGFTLGGWAGYTTSAFKAGSGNVETINWMGFLNFPDLLGEGNLAGIYVGQPPKIISSDLPAGRNIPSFINRGDFLAGPGEQPGTTIHVEGFYRFRVTDNISVTPGVIVIFNPNQNNNNDTITIGALRTTFTF
ncbi:MAG TPA: iron uptake porin [Coleofasciculaceae cyanobacterium]